MSKLNKFLTELYNENSDEYMGLGYLNNIYSNYSNKQKIQIATDNLSYPKNLKNIEDVLNLIKELKFLTNNNISILINAVEKDQELSSNDKKTLFEFIEYIK